MNTPDFTTTIILDQSPAEVFGAITNVRGWWSEEIEGGTSKLNDVFYYHFSDVHNCTIKLSEVIPDKKIVWYVLNNYFNFTKDRSEWKDTTMIFEISLLNNKTQLKFTHKGLVPEYECFDICTNAWTQYIRQSLFNLITIGKGQPNRSDNPQTADEKKFVDSH
ncbi:MAG: SRPBCC domain-containing protein [Chitinophagaceae bacterium]|nr:MAG: SRPBCC domain-containing protein [Chitinophagaceae bacterium]